MPTTGIYLITRVETGQLYVGQAVDIQRRIKEHKRAKDNIHVDRAIRKHGAAAFAFDILEECPEELLNDREIFWIQAFDTFENPDMGHYNHSSGGEGGGKRSAAAKAKMSGKNHPNYGKRRSAETRRRIAAAKKGRRHTSKTRAKISASRKGQRPSAESKAKMSMAQSGKNNPRYGKPVSMETRAKISAVKRGRNWTEGQRRIF